MARTRSFRNFRPGRPSAAPAPHEIVIDGYRIESLLGAGPLTAVYRAVLESHQQAVAVKVLLPHLAASETFVQRFLQAASSARAVAHERVLPCYDVGQANGWVYVAGELVDGRSLGDLEWGPSMDARRALHIASQIACGVEAIHGAGLVHGNLRPSNILIDDDDDVRLADLALPVVPDADPAGGQAAYLPPECLLHGRVPDGSADIHAIGLILLGLLHGEPPWAGLTRTQIIERMSAGDSAIAAADNLDGDVQAVVARAAASEPADRYQQVAQLREDLERLQYGFAPIHARTPPAQARESGIRPAPPAAAAGGVPGRMRAWRGGLSVIAGALVVTIIAVLAWPSSTPARPVPSIVPATSTAAPPAAAPPAAAPVVVAALSPQRQADDPSWAAAGGSDAHGRWCDLRVGRASQRFRLVRGGSFWMGSPLEEPGRAADEDRHLVTIAHDFWLADSEVAQELVSEIGAADTSAFRQPQQPVESISWNAVQELLPRIGAVAHAPVRLPTEAEWEYACRAGDAGALDPESAWTAATGAESPRVVRGGRPNAWGLHDMQGNVAEWVEDTYARYRREPASDPIATGGVHRVVRGGAWNLDPRDARPAARGKALPTTAYFHLGFRLAISAGAAAR